MTHTYTLIALTWQNFFSYYLYAFNFVRIRSVLLNFFFFYLCTLSYVCTHTISAAFSSEQFFFSFLGRRLHYTFTLYIIYIIVALPVILFSSSWFPLYPACLLSSAVSFFFHSFKLNRFRILYKFFCIANLIYGRTLRGTLFIYK